MTHLVAPRHALHDLSVAGFLAHAHAGIPPLHSFNASNAAARQASNCDASATPGATQKPSASNCAARSEALSWMGAASTGVATGRAVFRSATSMAAAILVLRWLPPPAVGAHDACGGALIAGMPDLLVSYRTLAHLRARHYKKSTCNARIRAPQSPKDARAQLRASLTQICTPADARLDSTTWQQRGARSSTPSRDTKKNAGLLRHRADRPVRHAARSLRFR